jgi:hypothetical protein
LRIGRGSDIRLRAYSGGQRHEVGPKPAAAGAFAQVPAQRGAPQRTGAQALELGADLRARRVARLAAGDQRAAALEDERLHLVARHAQHGADLVVRAGAELGEHERGALVLGQAGEVGQQVAQVLAALDGAREVLGRRLVGRGERVLAAPAQQREAAVAGDRVEPRAQVDGLVGADEVAVRRHEGVLDGVLGLLGRAQHVAAEPEDAAQVAVVEHLEGGLGARADGRDEAVVGGRARDRADGRRSLHT